jgi:hypothetical protein
MGVADQFYQSINNVELPNGSTQSSSVSQQRGVTSVMTKCTTSGYYSSLLPALLVLLLCAAAAVVVHHSFSSSASSGASSSSYAKKKRASSFRQYIPPGVNLASWYSLEDWFFVGDRGAVEVATPDDDIAANCLPPLHVDGGTGPRWNSETDLLAGLVRHYSSSNMSSSSSSSSSNHPRSSSATVEAAALKEVEEGEVEEGGGLELGPWGKAIRTIHAFRSSYYDVETELRTMSELGIEYVRIPVSWCWTDYDPSYLYTLLPPPSDDDTSTSSSNNNDDDNYSYMTDTEIKHKFTCRDPYYPEVHWPAISRPHFRRVLRACAKYNIGATIDLHTYPGGTSIGTFSGVWPRYSKFWTHGDVPSTATLTTSSDTSDIGTDVGRTLLANFIRWMESLEVSDPIAFKG